MSRVRVGGFAAWAPGLESDADWREWARDAPPLVAAGAPEVRFLPALLRRRCDGLARMMLHVVNECCPARRRADVASVFASRHGSLTTTAALLDDLARGTPLSPARFSHSVHNTQAGLFSLWSGNRAPSTAIASANETFAHGFLEAVCTSRRLGDAPVLLVCGDESVPDALLPVAERQEGAHALALLLDPSAEGPELDFELECADANDPTCDRPDAISFLHWWYGDAEELRIRRGSRLWRWRRRSGFP